MPSDRRQHWLLRIPLSRIHRFSRSTSGCRDVEQAGDMAPHIMDPGANLAIPSTPLTDREHGLSDPLHSPYPQPKEGGRPWWKNNARTRAVSVRPSRGKNFVR
jgi:hypothetical protein